MESMTIFPASRRARGEITLHTGRQQGRDVLIARGNGPASVGLTGGQPVGDAMVYPADYDNMLVWERQLAPAPKLVALNAAGYPNGYGAGNRIVVSRRDVPDLREPSTLGGWDGIYRAAARSAVPFWFIQQSIVRELIPEGVNPDDYPGIGHTGGYGPRELLRAGLFAYASLGGYGQPGGYGQALPIGADADHAIIIGRDEAALQASLALNKLALDESADYTKFTVDTSHLFGFTVTLSAAERRRLQGAFLGRRFEVANLLPGRAGFAFRYDEETIWRLGHKYWRACAVHKEIYDHVARLRAGRPFDYELSLDETPEPTAPEELFFYLVLLRDVMGVPEGGVASAGPNIGFIKRHDFEGDPQRELEPQANACASILRHFGAMLSVHSADGVRAATGKGPGVDAALLAATGGACELKVADVYQEVLWQVLAASDDPAERELFAESWRRTYDAVRLLAQVYRAELAGMTHEQAQKLLSAPEGRAGVAARHGAEGLRWALGAIGYGLPVFALAAQLVDVTDPARPDPEAELFRRFMFLPYRALRGPLFRTLTRAGWDRLADAVDEATMIRLRAMGWA